MYSRLNNNTISVAGNALLSVRDVDERDHLDEFGALCWCRLIWPDNGLAFGYFTSCLRRFFNFCFCHSYWNSNFVILIRLKYVGPILITVYGTVYFRVSEGRCFDNLSD